LIAIRQTDRQAGRSMGDISAGMDLTWSRKLDLSLALELDLAPELD
jgi:hypothetical protein